MGGSDGVSVLVCTRDRPDGIERAVRAVLASEAVELELIVVDQSDGPATAQRLAALADDRVRYVRHPAGGKPAALNLGLQLARGSIVVVTDDDCEPPAGWVAGMARILTAWPHVGLVFSNVVSPPYDHRLGYVPTYERTTDRIVRSIGATCRGRGLGAGMAMRRDVVLALGGVDDAIGPGARFQSGDDWDLELRLLLKGWEVYETAELWVLHHGFRSYADGRAHARSNWYGMGAVVAKPVRAGHVGAVGLALWQLWANVALPALADVAHLRRPRGLGRIPAFCRGFAGGLSTHVDRANLRYRIPGDALRGAGAGEPLRLPGVSCSSPRGWERSTSSGRSRWAPSSAARATVLTTASALAWTLGLALRLARHLPVLGPPRLALGRLLGSPRGPRLFVSRPAPSP